MSRTVLFGCDAMPGTKFSKFVRRESVIAAAYELAAGGGLRAITIRDVAARADVSTGLVLFHFNSKEQLVLELLDWVLATTTAVHVGPEISVIPSPLDRLVALLTQEMLRLSAEPARIRVFFEFWAAGLWDPQIRDRMQPELDRYRAAFYPIAARVIEADPHRFSDTTPDALAAVAVSFVKGCAVQCLIEPTLSIDGFLATAESLLRGSLDNAGSNTPRSSGGYNFTSVPQ
jgi:TetR/AcrR family transcriptional repressor of bet genes